MESDISCSPARSSSPLVWLVEGVLHMAMLNYDEEIRPAAEVAAGFKAPRGLSRKVQLAQTLIHARIAGLQVEQPPEEEEPEIHNLIDALKQKLAQSERGKSRDSKKRRSA